jgi:hypothetical protein
LNRLSQDFLGSGFLLTGFLLATLLHCFRLSMRLSPVFFGIGCLRSCRLFGLFGFRGRS